MNHACRLECFQVHFCTTISFPLLTTHFPEQIRTGTPNIRTSLTSLMRDSRVTRCRRIFSRLALGSFPPLSDAMQINSQFSREYPHRPRIYRRDSLKYSIVRLHSRCLVHGKFVGSVQRPPLRILFNVSCRTPANWHCANGNYLISS